MRWLVALFVLAPTLAWGADCPGVTTPLSPMKTSIESLTVAASVITLTVPEGARQATLYVEDQPIRWTTDSTAPTATVGMLAKADSVLVLCGASVSSFKMIRQGSTSATVKVSYDK